MTCKEKRHSPVAVRHTSSVTPKRHSKAASLPEAEGDMQGMTKRGSVYYARLIIPKDRWADTGRVTGARNGTRRDIVKSLETKDYREALRRRDAALSAMREAINQALSAHNLPPLQGSWSPSLGSSLQTQILEQALKARKDLAGADDYRTPEYLNDDPSEGIVVSESFSSRDFGADIVNEALAQAANRIAAQYPGSKGQRMADEAYHQAHDIAFGLTTPLSILLDRWLPQLEGNVTQELIDRHHRGFSRLGQYLAESQGSKTSDPEGFVRTIAIETIDKKVVGHFREWLEALPGIGPRVVASHLSTMNTFWKWAEQVGYAETNPWQGSTHGLKKKIANPRRAMTRSASRRSRRLFSRLMRYRVSSVRRRRCQGVRHRRPCRATWSRVRKQRRIRVPGSQRLSFRLPPRMSA
ncbi:MAG: DUF6538 domain-containing protein [Gluconobacter sp.]|nr:DUF6538 domain-containing protein [Acetobacter aceti]